MVKGAAIRWLILLVALTVGIYYYADSWVNGFNRKEYSLNEKKCKMVGGISGPEDAIPFEHFLILSRYDGMFTHVFCCANQSNGGFFIYNTQNETLRAVNVKKWPAERALHPMGLDIYNNELYAVNHPFQEGQNTRIEVFNLKITNIGELEIKYKRSHSLPALNGMISSLAVFDTDKYFTSQYQYFKAPALGYQFTDTWTAKWNMLYLYLMKRNSFVHRCYGEECQETVIMGSMLNGVTLKGDMLYVADTLQRRIVKYNVSEPMYPVFYDQIDLDVHPDNLHYDPVTDRVYGGYITTLRSPMRYVEEMMKGGAFPTQDYFFGGSFELDKENFRDIVRTNKLSGISGSVVINNQVYITSWIAPGFLTCPRYAL